MRDLVVVPLLGEIWEDVFLKVIVLLFVQQREVVEHQLGQVQPESRIQLR